MKPKKVKTRKTSTSLFLKVMIPVACLALFIITAFGVTLGFGGVVDGAEKSSESILREKSTESASSAGNFMNYTQSLVEDCALNVKKTAYEISGEDEAFAEKIKDGSLSRELLSRVFDDLVALLRKSGTNEVFLILESGDDYGDGKKDCIYIRDLDPSDTHDDNSDLLMEAGSYDVAEQNGINLDSGWTERITTDGYSDFYNLPVNAVKNSGGDTDIHIRGFWSEPSPRFSGDVSSIKYSVALVDENGEVFAVLGTGIFQNTLSHIMPDIASDRNDDSFYVLAKGSEEDDKLRVCWYFGSAFEKYYGNSAYISFGKTKENGNGILEALPLYSKDKELVATVGRIPLYNGDVSDKDEDFYIAVISEKDAVYYSRGKMIAMLAVLTVVGLGAATLVSAIISRFVSKAAQKAVADFVESDPKEPLAPSNTGIREIDRVADCAKDFAREASRSASRYADIVRKVNLKIGFFDFNLSSGMVFVSGTMFRLFNISNTTEDITVGEQQFDDLFGLTRARLERKKAVIKRVPEGRAGQEKWLKITVRSQDDKILGAVEDITDEMSAKRLIEYERDHDSLTGLLSKNAFRDMLYTKFSFPYDLKISALVTIDLDDLKRINDTLGHDYGDEYIKAAVAVIKRYTNVTSGFAGILSGDEFQMFLSGADSKDQLRCLIKELERELKQACITLASGERINVKASAGIAWYPEDSDNPDMLVKYAGFAKLIAKKESKGSFLEFDINKYNNESVTAASSNELMRIIRESDITFVFQPVVEVSDGRIVGYEALMRPCSEMLKTPNDLLRVARSDAKLYDIEKLAFEKSFEAFIILVKEGVVPKGTKLFINSVSNASLHAEEAESLFRRFPEIYENVVLEIRENDQLVDEYYTHKRRRVNEQWKGLIALDNFGTSYNNEFSLIRVEPDIAKIDMSIIRNIDSDESRQEIFLNLMEHCRKWDVLTAAVGIETREELETVVKMGVDYVQGLFVGRPSPIPGEITSRAAEILGKTENKVF